MASVNGTLLHRLRRAELLMPLESLESQPATQVDEHEQFWWPVFQGAPQPLWDYFCAVPDTESHPAAKDAYEALWHRIEHPHRLAHVQGEILKWAHWRYAWHLARQRQTAGVTTSVMYDAYVQEQAAQQLMGWTHRDSTAAWPHPTRFVRQWRNGTRIHVSIHESPHAETGIDVLAAAGLHREELQLLQEEDD